MLIGCLGGHCQSREMCAHYLQGQATEDIRLCGIQEEPELIKEYDKPNEEKGGGDGLQPVV